MRISRHIVPMMALLALGACSTAQNPLTGVQPQPELQTAANTRVVEATCPKIFMQDGTAFHRTYAKGGDGDPQKIVYQASFAQTTRACTVNEQALNITVVAQGRLIAGPMGGPGRVSLPVLIEVKDGETVLYSQVTRFDAEMPGNDPVQFIFRKDDISIPGGAGKQARVYIGFDSSPQKAPAKKRRK